MAFFDFKINSIFIRKNRDIGKSEIKIFSLVTNSNYNTFLFDKIVNEQSEDKKIELLKVAANEVLGFKEFLTINNIKDNQLISFGFNGYSIFKSSTIPESFDVTLAIMDSDEGVRKLGEFINNFVNHKSFDSFAGNLLKMATSMAAPQAVLAAELTKFIGKVVAGVLLSNSDDQIGVYLESFNIYEHYPNLNLKAHDVEDLTRNCLISYSLFGKKD